MKPKTARRPRADRVEVERMISAERARFGDDLSVEETTRVVVRIKALQETLKKIK